MEEKSDNKAIKNEKKKRIFRDVKIVILTLLITYLIHVILLIFFNICFLCKCGITCKCLKDDYIPTYGDGENNISDINNTNVGNNINNNSTYSKENIVNNTNNKIEDTNQNNDKKENQNTKEEQEIQEFVVESEDFKWGENSVLKIFNSNKVLTNELNYISPEEEGTYDFNVSNTIGTNMSYKLSFSEENRKNINLKYKIKKNGSYLVDEWTYIKDIDLGMYNLTNETKDQYTLEWKWVERTPEEDLESSGGNYKIEIKVYAEKNVS